MLESQDRICGVTVRGFKSICEEQSLVLRPLTILAGVNSSGKSSFMQPLLLLKQTLESAGDPGALLLDGENVRFTMADQVLSRGPRRACADAFGVRVALADGQSIELSFRPQQGRGFDLARMRWQAGDRSVDVVPGMPHEDIVKILPTHLRTLHEKIAKRETGPLSWMVRRERCFFVFEMIGTAESRRHVPWPYGVSPSQAFVHQIRRVIHLPGLRGNPRRTYPKTAGGPEFQGTFEPYVASVIAQWQANEGRNQLAALGEALESMGLTWKVKAHAVDDTQVELKVGRLPHGKRGGAQDLVNIADVGFGVSQSLPVLVALLAAEPGQLVYLEQPEIHLHPLAQRRLAKILLRAAQRGVVTVVETHSAILLREIQTLIADRELSKDDVAFHWLQRGEEGETTVTTAQLDKSGAYGDWPQDFDDTELNAERAYLDAVESRGSRR